MSHILNLKRGDTAPLFRARCLDAATPVNLETATSVKLLMRKGSEPILDDAMTVEDQDDNPGWVHRSWEEDDLAEAGLFRAEVEVTWGDGTVQTFPAAGYVTIRITEDIG